MTAYLRDPEEITRRSFEIVRREAALDSLPEPLHDMAVRLVHACGMPDIVADLAFGGDPMGAGHAALGAGAPILVDARMVAAGVIAARLPAANEIVCTLGAVDAKGAAACGDTRSAAAVELWAPRLSGAVVAVGNAPTALFRLLELLADGAPRPACILAFPVGFVGAVEAKEALIGESFRIPFVTLRGRRGGSAMAAAAVNALAAP